MIPNRVVDLLTEIQAGIKAKQPGSIESGRKVLRMLIDNPETNPDIIGYLVGGLIRLHEVNLRKRESN